MTEPATTTDTGEKPKRSSVGGNARGGSFGMVLVVALALVGALVGLMFVGRANTGNYILAVLATLSTVGIFSLLALASGIIRFAGKNTGDPTIRAVVDNAFDGIVVTDPAGRVTYANAAYLALVDAVDEKDVRPVERVFIGDPDVSEAVYRLLKASREGRRLQEEVRVAALNGKEARWLRMRVRPLEDGKKSRNSTVWSIADVTRDREKQENVFQELQHAIDYLDHAPAGFFSVDGKGAVVYLNATLAGWLDHDLASVGSGGLKLADIVSGEGVSLLTTMNAVARRSENRSLRSRSENARRPHRAGAAVPQSGVRRRRRARRVAHAGAQPRQDVGIDPQRAAEVRFMRFFNNTPMAIATVDRSGKISRSNGLFARLFHGLIKDGQGRRPLDPLRRRRTRPRRRSKPRSRRRSKGRAISRRSRPRSRARPSATRRSMSPRPTTRRATRKPPSSTRSKPPTSASWKTRSSNRRKWNPSASSPAASRTTSTMCSPPS